MSMSITSQIHSLKAALTTSCEVLTDPDDPKFREHLKRWSDIDLKVPAAIVLPTSEEDCQKTVGRFLIEKAMHGHPNRQDRCSGLSSPQYLS